MEEKLSICCTSFPDPMFHYDEESGMGICYHCKEHSQFITEEEQENEMRNL
tara:strand:- start:2561 stop:2713 length:153 start_codon:yes stop_codon:yes gene_type:complete